MAKSPNFILFITDQHRADLPRLLRPSGAAHAAHRFDRRARHRVRPVLRGEPGVQPNRASLMTGRMPSVHGVRSNGIPLSMNAVTFVDLLRDAGYRTALIGKSHLQNFTRARSDHQAAAAAAGLSRAIGRACAQALRHDLADPKYEQETPDYWTRQGRRMCRRRSTASTT